MNLLGNSVIAKLTCEKIALEALSLSRDATDAHSGSQGTAATSGREGLQIESLC